MNLLPTPEEFDERYSDDDALAAEIPERPITSLRDLQYVWGRLYTLATAGGGAYASYLTPEQAIDLFDEPDSLLYLQVDLSDGHPILDPEMPVRVRQYERELVEPVAHSWYNAARGFDHSITHRTGRNKEPAEVGEYLYERLSQWAADDVIQGVAAEHPDGWIIEALDQLGEQDGLEQTIIDATEIQIDGPTTALTTVAVRLQKDDYYLLPGELDSDVFDAAMRERKRAKLRSKGKATNSVGQATDLVTDELSRVVGTAEDPLNYFTGKQLERFPGLDPDEAWRNHPVTEDVALSLQNASPFVDACSYYTMGVDVYYLPYFFGHIGPDDARDLYGLLYNLLEKQDLSPIEESYRRYQDTPRAAEIAKRLRFYVGAVAKPQAKRFDVLGDTMDGSLLHPIEFIRTHQEVIGSWVFDADAIPPHPQSRPAMPTHGNWKMFTPDEELLLGMLVSGWYFEQTFALPDDNQAAAADDFRVRALVATLTNERLPVEEVISEYVDRLIDDEGEGFPHLRLAAQYAQLCALAAAGLLEAEEDSDLKDPRGYAEGHEQETMYTNDTHARADGGTNAEARETKLAQFLDQTPALSDANPERRGGFLLGALVGHVSRYQSYEGRSTTLVDQHNIKAISERKLKRIVSEVLDKNVVYSRERGYVSTMYREVVDRLVETMTQIDFDEGWGIDTADLRYHYALGVAYGMNNWPRSGDESDSTDQTADTETNNE